MGKKNIKIDKISLGIGSPVFIIAEIGINHNGDMDIARKLINAASIAGADAVKLQTYITEKRISKDHQLYPILKQCELSFNDQEKLFALGRDLNIVVFSTPFDNDSVDFLYNINCPVYKVASFDTVNKHLLRKIGSTSKPVIMSTGMTSYDELLEAIKALGRDGNGEVSDLALLHCVSAYPLSEKGANLSLIPYLHNIHEGPVGYSDHTIGVKVPVLSVAAGANIIEKHFTLDINAKGPDHAMSANPDTLNIIVKEIRKLEDIMGFEGMGINDHEASSVGFRRLS